jgi:hypothetical protein
MPPLLGHRPSLWITQKENGIKPTMRVQCRLMGGNDCKSSRDQRQCAFHSTEELEIITFWSPIQWLTNVAYIPRSHAEVQAQCSNDCKCRQNTEHPCTSFLIWEFANAGCISESCLTCTTHLQYCTVPSNSSIMIYLHELFFTWTQDLQW